jgi:hypothetical protein
VPHTAAPLKPIEVHKVHTFPRGDPYHAYHAYHACFPDDRIAGRRLSSLPGLSMLSLLSSHISTAKLTWGKVSLILVQLAKCQICLVHTTTTQPPVRPVDGLGVRCPAHRVLLKICAVALPLLTHRPTPLWPLSPGSPTYHGCPRNAPEDPVPKCPASLHLSWEGDRSHDRVQ